MNRPTLAVATAMLVAGVGAALGPAPFAAAQSSVCDLNDFSIPSSEPLLARTLRAGASEVGTVDVDAGPDDTLEVKLSDPGLNGKLHWVVMYDPGSGCERLDPVDCEGNITSQFQDDCTLDAPPSGTRTYHVLFEELNDINAIDYKTWVP